LYLARITILSCISVFRACLVTCKNVSISGRPFHLQTCFLLIAFERERERERKRVGSEFHGEKKFHGSGMLLVEKMKMIKDIISQLQFEFTTISKLKVHHKCNDLFDQVHSKKTATLYCNFLHFKFHHQRNRLSISFHHQQHIDT